MFNTIVVILIALYLLDLFNITESFKDQIGVYNVCPVCEKPKNLCGCDHLSKDGKGKWVQYKYPHYYGLGTWGYHYGEPYYYRHIQFPYPGTTCNKKE